MLAQPELSQRIAGDVYHILESSLRTDDTQTDAILEGILSKRGKCIRPLFMALTAELAGGSWSRCMQAAAVVEAIHLASLLHDDVVDCSDLRRGAETVNASHSDKVSVLYGDHIFITALRMAQELGDPDAVGIIFDTVIRMVRGEIRDTLDNGVPDEDAYFAMIGNKTASLFAAAGELSVIFSGNGNGTRAMARKLGESVGIMFQIVDDALDYDGDRATMGKPAGVDARGGHMTLPLIYSLRGLSPDERRQVTGGSHDRLYALVRDRGGVEYALGRARDFADDARRTVSAFGNGRMADALGQLLDSLLQRHA